MQTPGVVDRAQVRLEHPDPQLTGGRLTGENAAQSFSLAYFMGIILYMAILLYGINVMSSVLEEKTTRIVEVLVSSLKPFQLMLGKVIGVGAVSPVPVRDLGDLRPAHLFATGPASAGRRPGRRTGVYGSPCDPGDGGIFLAYFIGGFMLLSAMFAAVGAMSSMNRKPGRRSGR